MKRILLFILISSFAFAQEHRFLNKINVALFSGVAAVRALDLDSTWRFRAEGIDEASLSNALVDNKPAFTAYSFSMVGANILGAYALHRLGLHKIEPWISAAHIGFMGYIDVHNYRTVRQYADR